MSFCDFVFRVHCVRLRNKNGNGRPCRRRNWRADRGSHWGGQGALIGGAVGAIGGGLVGAALDEQDRKMMEQSSPRTVERMDHGEPLTISDVIKLSQGGVSDETIIRYIKRSETTYNLSQAQIDRLKEAGVNQRVINYMVNTGD